MKRKLITIVALVAFGTLAGSTQAFAQDANPEYSVAAAVVQPGPNTVGTNEIKNKGITLYDLGDQSVWGVHIKDLTIPESKFGWDFRNKITNTYNESAAAKAKSEQALTKANEALAKPDNNTPDSVNKHCNAVTIQHTGGSFKTLKTPVCSFTLPAGTWMVNTSAFFARVVAGDASHGVRPQLALRVGASDTVFGDDYGTILGAEISATVNRELTGSATKVVTVPAGGVTVEVFGHGYQDNTGDDGAQIAVAADVAAVRIG